MLHRAAGLIVSADRPLPGFGAPVRPQPAQLRIHLESWPSWHEATAAMVHASETRDAAGQPVVTVSRSPEGYHLNYADGTGAWVAAAGTEVWCVWPDSASLADTCTYLSGPILGLVLRLRGALALHASAVQVGAGAIAFAGPHDAGKSTIAAALGSAGCRVVTDDVLHLRHDGPGWVAEPFAPLLKLWPDGARLALGDRPELPVIAAGWDKRALVAGEGIVAADRPVPLTAIAFLLPRGRAWAIEPMAAAPALVRLAANSSATHLLDTAGRATEFIALSKLVRSVPCAAVTPPEDRVEYPAFTAGVLDWAQSLDGKAAG